MALSAFQPFAIRAEIVVADTGHRESFDQATTPFSSPSAAMGFLARVAFVGAAFLFEASALVAHSQLVGE